VKIAVGSDHAAFAHKQHIVETLREEGHDILDVGCDSAESCDYPDFAKQVAQAVSKAQTECGILLCGTGLGMCMSANKVHGIRAAVCHDEYTTIMSRSHNNANVLCMGGRVLAADEAMHLVRIWLRTRFEGGRHKGRVDKVMKIEEEECGGK